MTESIKDYVSTSLPGRILHLKLNKSDIGAFSEEIKTNVKQTYSCIYKTVEQSNAYEIQPS